MIVVTSGEPAGIGPDIILKIANESGIAAIVFGDIDVFKARAKEMNLAVNIQSYQGQTPESAPGQLLVQHLPIKKKVEPGKPCPENAEYILAQLDAAVAGCLTKNYDAVVTAPVNKSIICQAGHHFTGHTDYIARLTQTKNVVMMLACDKMRVALVTTHLPLAEVASEITPMRIEQTVMILRASLQNQFGISSPKIFVAGLNPHAGEDGYLGREETDIIAPVLRRFNTKELIGPMAADTMFSQENCASADAFLAMYHDQGLSVLKYAGFGEAANITLGLPIVRTSVDHGTAFALTGTGKVKTGSLKYAIAQAQLMAQNQSQISAL